ncbi:MAG TPA: inositol monophosphatase family protein [Spirochaetota bacterium]|nr:inositol monophosphatase family protein [Spirochaetota bacterium]
MDERTAILDFAREIALQAGKILLKGFRSPGLTVSYKGVSNPVTSVDRESEDFLYERIRDRYPDHGVVAEEGHRADGSGEYLWYVDPLDGTTNFAHGVAHFSVSIGVYSKRANRMAVGIVYDPCRGELFGALAGGGAFLNEEVLRVTESDDLSRSLVATGFPYDKNISDKNNLVQFNRVLPRVQCIRRFGSAALDLCYVAAGRFDAYWEMKVSPWDIAAGCLIVEEAGGVVTRFDGGRYDIKFPEVLAANPILHPLFIDLLAGVYD